MLKGILLIDDNEADNEFHKLMLEKAQAAEYIDYISNTRVALNVWKNGFESLGFVPQLILLDINMPAFNGFELLDRIKELPTNFLDQTKIIMLTGSINPEDHKRATTEYADIISGYYLKPLSSKTVEDILSGIETTS